MLRWLDVRPETIPSELRALPSVVWRGETRGTGKASKVPYQARDPRRHASSTNPATWGTFDDAISAYARPEWRLDGVGIVLTPDAGISCLDLDGAIIEDGTLTEPAQTIITQRAPSWTEISPSGRGLHVFVRGCVPRAIKGAGLEVYSTSRYIAVTGHRWGG